MEQFEEILQLSNGTQVAAYLKRMPEYSSKWDALDENTLHRGQIEKLLKKSIFQNFSRIYHFANLEQRKFLDLYSRRYEIRVLKEVMTNIFDHLLDMVELKNVKKKKLKTYSGGMIRRIGIAQALLNNPEILILDEPTAGLDPKERVRFRNVISSLGKNRMVLLSTHIVSDIDYIADRILIMKNGELIQEGTEKEITDKVEGCVWKCIVSEKEAGQITSSFIVSNMRSRGESVELRIVSKRQPVVGAENIESTLEDAYLYHTQITGEEKNATL